MKKLNQNDQDYKYKSDYKEIKYSDIDKDGDQDAVVLLSFRESETGHVTTVSYKTVVFSNTNGQFDFTTDLQSEGLVDSWSVKDNTILISTVTWSTDDPSCCPSIKTKLAYTLQGNRLERVKR